MEQMKLDGEISQDDVRNYIDLMLDSCDDIIEALERPLLSTSR